VLTRERARAERSDLPVILALVGVANARAAGVGSSGDALIARLAAATEATDIMGWYETDAVIGVIRRATVEEPGKAGKGPVDGALGRRLEAERTRGYSVRVRVHPEPRRQSGEDLPLVDPLLYPDLTSRRSRRTRAEDTIKRCLDVVGSIAALVALSPLFAIAAILVKATSPGPVLFGQTRVGHMMKPFVVRKFRTMYVHADPRIHHEFVRRFITASGRDGAGFAGGFFKLTDDPRVTPVGRILRKTSIDELPQLWNVLRGEMSLVGPRPPLPYELAQYRPWHRRRVLEAKPGITGLWQVTGRSRTTFEEMVRLDLRYARTRSLLVDLRILRRTPATVISGKGAC
jgi:lipopolysaccharide/colanic/teichoic acid biosynthesis glycosyltransferase